MLNGGNRYLDDDPKMISGVAHRWASPEAQKYAIAPGLNELLLEARGIAQAKNAKSTRSTIQILFHHAPARIFKAPVGHR